jgi:hypothetical protein
MDLYLAAAYEAEQINKPGNEPTSVDWLEVVKRTHRACKTALRTSIPMEKSTAAEDTKTFDTSDCVCGLTAQQLGLLV